MTSENKIQIRPAGLRASTLVVLAVVLAFLLILAWLDRPWAMAAVPMGFLFGFFLQKGFLCPASACSELLLFRSGEKLAALGCCIVIAMVGYAVLDWTGWIALDPAPFLWANLMVGGALFGAGMVMAGGCIAGSLFKAGTGNLNSLTALPAVLLGVYLVRDGWLQSLHTALHAHSLSLGEGDSATWIEITGLSYPLLAGIAATILLLIVLWRRRSRSPAAGQPFRFHEILHRPWKPWQSGVAIGILAPWAVLCASIYGYHAPLGATDGVLNTLYLVMGKPRAIVWPVLFCSALVVGSWFSGRLSGQTRLLPKPREQVIIAFIGGLLLGMGAAFADGCFYGHIVSGWALLNVGGFLFALVAIPVAWVTTYFYLLGGPAMGKPRKGGP